MIRYDDIVLHSERGDTDAQALRTYLTANNIKFADLVYDDQTDDLTAIAGWFDKEWTRPMAVLTFDKVLWEAADKSDKYEKTLHALKASELPDNFVEMAEKTG